MYYTQIRANALASALTGGLDGIVTYTATPGQTGFPTSLTTVPLRLDPKRCRSRSNRRATSRSARDSATFTGSSSRATA